MEFILLAVGLLIIRACIAKPRPHGDATVLVFRRTYIIEEETKKPREPFQVLEAKSQGGKPHGQ
jgi:hypothetical protein